MKLIPTSQIEKALNIKKKNVLQKAEKENWQYVKRGNRFYWLAKSMPEKVQHALFLHSQGYPVPTQAVQAPTTVFAKATNAERDVAKLRAAILNAYKISRLTPEDFCPVFNTEEQYSALSAKYKKSLRPRTLYRWIEKYRVEGIDGITPRYSTADRTVESSLTETEKSLLMHFYLHYNKRSISHCILTMKANIVSTASESTCRRFLNGLPKDVVTFYREGSDKFNDKFLPYIEGNKELYKSLDKVQMDHHTFDFLILKDGRRIRPFLTTIIDVPSGAVLGYCLSINPNSQSILVAYAMAITNFGVPKIVHVDNGKDFRGKTIKGYTEKIKITFDSETEIEEEVLICGSIIICGSEIHFSRPHHGQSKGVQERFYGFVAQYLSKNTTSYLGSDNTARVDEQKLLFRAIKGFEKRKDNEIMTWEELCEIVPVFINYYNNSWISEADGRKGRTAGEVFMGNIPPEGFRQIDKETMELALTRGEVKKVYRNGVRYGATYYWAEELMRLVGQDVIARISMLDRNEVLICDYTGKLLCKAYANVFLETGDLEADNANLNRVHRAIRQGVREDGSYSLPFKPKNLLELAIENQNEQTAHMPLLSGNTEGTLREALVKDTNEEKELPPIKQAHKKPSSKYKSYFESDDLDIIRNVN